MAKMTRNPKVRRTRRRASKKHLKAPKVVMVSARFARRFDG